MLQAINQGETPGLEAIEIEINLLNGKNWPTDCAEHNTFGMPSYFPQKIPKA